MSDVMLRITSKQDFASKIDLLIRREAERGGTNLVQQLIVVISADSFLVKAKIVVIVSQLQIVGANIHHLLRKGSMGGKKTVVLVLLRCA